MHHPSFGTMIAAARQALGYTQPDALVRINELLRPIGKKIGKSYLSKLENRRLVPPSDSVIIAIAKTLKINQDDLLAIAGRAPADIGSLLARSQGARHFFRMAANQKLTEERWDRLIQVLVEKR